MKSVRHLPTGMALYYDPAPVREPYARYLLWLRIVILGNMVRTNR